LEVISICIEEIEIDLHLTAYFAAMRVRNGENREAL
jgi:hypothetical protein